MNESAIETSDDVLPLRCETTIDDRWTALKKIIEGPALKIVVRLKIIAVFT